VTHITGGDARTRASGDVTFITARRDIPHTLPRATRRTRAEGKIIAELQANAQWNC